MSNVLLGAGAMIPYMIRCSGLGRLYDAGAGGCEGLGLWGPHPGEPLAAAVKGPGCSVTEFGQRHSQQEAAPVEGWGVFKAIHEDEVWRAGCDCRSSFRSSCSLL